MRWLDALIGRDIARGTLVGTGLMGLRVVLQAAYLVLAARALSAAGYGQFAAVVSLVSLVSPLAGLGSGMVMLKRVSEEPGTLSSTWTAALRLTLISSLAFAAFLLPLSLLVLPGVEWRLATAIVAAEVLCAPLIVLAAFAFQAVGQFAAAHTISVVLYTVRVAVVGLLLALSQPVAPHSFAAAHLVATALGTFFALGAVQWRLRPRRDLATAQTSWREGLAYAASGVIGLVNSEIDKPLMLRLAGAETAGVFAAAFRLATAVTAPVGALMVAAAPAFFREAAQPPSRPLRVLAIAVAYSAVAAIGLIALAWLAPLLLGPAFEASHRLLQYLAPWLLFNAGRHIGCAALTTRGHQKVRLALEAAAAIVSPLLNIVLIPLLGALGAACTITITDAMIAVAAWLFLLGRRRRSARVETVY
jgi:O-antigen/teichoic acid export membrane protein